MIALIDGNNFFVSCERALEPCLANRPVVVLSNNDGCVISRSNEAKQIGIPMGAPYFKYRTLFIEHNVVMYSVNFDLYQHFSNRVANELKNHSDYVQPYSIDESFVKVPIQNNMDILKWGRAVQESIASKTTIPVSVGIAPNKTLAKLASLCGKQGSGVYSIIDGVNLEEVLIQTGIQSVWGVGSRLADQFRRHGIKQAIDLVKADNLWIRKNFGIVGLRTKLELQGLSTSSWESGEESRKGISSTRSFGVKVDDFNLLRDSLIRHVQTATRKLRRQRSVAGKISIFIKTSRHSKSPQHSGHLSESLVIPTDDALFFSSLIEGMLHRIYVPGILYYRSGVFLSDIQPSEGVKSQLDLGINSFNHHTNVMRVLDSIQAKFGDRALRISCIPQKPKWESKSAYKSYSQSFKSPESLPMLYLEEEL
jgi:DNA polymerase V